MIIVEKYENVSKSYSYIDLTEVFLKNTIQKILLLKTMFLYNTILYILYFILF